MNNKTVVQGGFNVAFLNGGAYEYGTNKVAVNYGNLLVGSFTRGSTGVQLPSYGSWDTNILPNPSADTLQSDPWSRNADQRLQQEMTDMLPIAEQWNINVQRELPYNMFVTAAWVGNRVIHLPSQLNALNQLNPKYFSLGSTICRI